MNSLIQTCRTAATNTLAVLAMSAAATSAHAITLQIDPAQSSVTFTSGGVVLCDPDGNCGTLPEPQTFTLSGSNAEVLGAGQDLAGFAFSYHLTPGAWIMDSGAQALGLMTAPLGARLPRSTASAPSA